MWYQAAAPARSPSVCVIKPHRLCRDFASTRTNVTSLQIPADARLFDETRSCAAEQTAVIKASKARASESGLNSAARPRGQHSHTRSAGTFANEISWSRCL